MKKILFMFLCAALTMTALFSAQAQEAFELSSGIDWNTKRQELKALMGKEPAVLDHLKISGVYAMYFGDVSVSLYEDADFLAFFINDFLAAAGYEMQETTRKERYDYLLSALESKYGEGKQESAAEGEALLKRIEEIGLEKTPIENMVCWTLEDGTEILLFHTPGKVRLYYLNRQRIETRTMAYETQGI